MKMGYWKSKFTPMFRMVFDRNAGKRTAAAEACKSFEGSKDSYNTEFEEKKAELKPKVLEIYEASSADIKTFVKEPTEPGLKKNSTAVHSFLEQLVKIEFPGSQAACDASSMHGASHVVEPILYVFEKVSTLVITEEKEAGTEAPPPTKTEEATSGTEREIVIEEGMKEEKVKEQVKEKEEGAEKVTEKTEEIAKEDKEKEKEKEKEKPVEPAVAPTQGEAKAVEPEVAAVLTQVEGKPVEPAMASLSNEPAKKSEEAVPATTDPSKV